MTTNPTTTAALPDGAEIAELERELGQRTARRDSLRDYARFLVTERRCFVTGLRVSLVGPVDRALKANVQLVVAVETLLSGIRKVNLPSGCLATMRETVRFWRAESESADRAMAEAVFTWNLRALLWQRKAMVDASGELVPLRYAEPDELTWLSQRRFELFTIGRNARAAFANLNRETSMAVVRMKADPELLARGSETMSGATRMASTLHIADALLTGWLVDAIDPDITDEVAEADFPIEALDDVCAHASGDQSDVARVSHWLAAHCSSASAAGSSAPLCHASSEAKRAQRVPPVSRS